MSDSTLNISRGAASLRSTKMKNAIQILMKNGGGFELTTLATAEEVDQGLSTSRDTDKFFRLTTLTQHGAAVAYIMGADVSAFVLAPTGQTVTVENGIIQ